MNEKADHHPNLVNRADDWFQDLPIQLKLLLVLFVVGVCPFLLMSALWIIQHWGRAPSGPNPAALLISVGLVLSLLATALLARMIVEPLRELTRGVEALMSGEMRSLALERRDELGSLAIAFERLLLERDAATLAMRASESRMRAIFEHTTDAVFIKDVNGRYLMINPAGAAFLGKTVEEVIGRRDEEVFSPESGRWLWERDKEIMLSGTLHSFEEPDLRTQDGRVRTYLATKYPYRDEEGRIIGMIGISRDITERKREAEAHAALVASEQQARAEAEAAKELNRLKNAFVNSVSHELRTPLTSILGYAEFLEDKVGGPLTSDQQNFVTQIERSTVRLKHLVDDLLDSARLDAGTFKLSLASTDFVEQARVVLESMKPQAQEAGIRLEADLPPSAMLATFDPQRIEQVLINLVGNAIKFTPSGGHIKLRACMEDGHLRCEVEDTGVGIPAESLPSLFKRFQGSRPGVRNETGTGIGLSISKALVEAHHGDIGVESEPDQGSTFWFTLPVVPATNGSRDGDARTGTSD